MKPGWAWLLISAAGAWAQVPATTDAASPDRAHLPGWGRRIVELLEIQPGSTVADVGAGRGTFLPIWSVAVGSAGRVIAKDIDKTSMDHARELGKQHNCSNIEFVLGTPRDAMLPERCADLIILIDAYHEFTYPADMLASLSKALKADGRLAIIDPYKADKFTPGLPPPHHVRLNRDDAINEIQSNGFRLVSNRDYFEGRRYVVIFVKNHQN